MTAYQPEQVFLAIEPVDVRKGADTAPVLPAIIDSGLATPGLLAWVMTQKYADHLPLYRIEQLSGRYGLTLPRSTLASWVGQVGVALQPLVDRLAEILRQQPVLHVDETPVGQLDPGRGKTKRAYLSAYRNSPLLEHARNFLQKWQGHLVVDDYGGYKACFTDGKVTELGCMAHARRKFFDLTASQPHPVAAQALDRIAQLYQVEREADEADCARAYSPEAGTTPRKKYSVAQGAAQLDAGSASSHRSRVRTGTGV